VSGPRPSSTRRKVRPAVDREELPTGWTPCERGYQGGQNTRGRPWAVLLAANGQPPHRLRAESVAADNRRSDVAGCVSLGGWTTSNGRLCCGSMPVSRPRPSAPSSPSRLTSSQRGIAAPSPRSSDRPGWGIRAQRCRHSGPGFPGRILRCGWVHPIGQQEASSVSTSSQRQPRPCAVGAAVRCSREGSSRGPSSGPRTCSWRRLPREGSCVRSARRRAASSKPASNSADGLAGLETNVRCVVRDLDAGPTRFGRRARRQTHVAGTGRA